MRFKTVEHALRHQFVGNYAADHEAFDAIEKLARRSDATDQRRLYDHLAVNGMGFPALTDQQVQEGALEEWLVSVRITIR